MDGQRFDTLISALSRTASRRATFHGLAATVVTFLATIRGAGAQPLGYFRPGAACYDDSQCASSDTTYLGCADNGFDYDGPLNCCTYEGGYCDSDEGCCGAFVCDNNVCGGQAATGNMGGSISVQGLLCPSPDASYDACDYSSEIFVGDIELSGPNGMWLTLNEGTSHAVSHVWDNLPYGAYYVQSFGADPAYYRLERIDGTTVTEPGVEAVVIGDANPNPSITFIYVPA